MSADLEKVLQRTSQQPTRPLDVEGLLHRARRQWRRSRLARGASAVVVIVALLGAVPQLGGPSVIFDEAPDVPDVPADVAPTDPPPPTVAPPSTDPAGVLLPPAPIEGREGAVAVWTGAEVLVWGGGLTAEMGSHPDLVETGERDEADGSDPIPIGEVRFADGAAYDPAARQWRPMAAAPFTGWYWDQAVWTGQEMLVWSSELQRLAAYDPTSDDWRALPDPPPTAQEGLFAVAMVWTGSEAILWGGYDHQPELPAFGAAYDPAADEWRELPPAPVPPRQWHTAAWTGQEMIVWGDAIFEAHLGAELGGAAYDPATDTWRTLPPAPTGGREDAVAVRSSARSAWVWSGREVLIVGGGLIEGLAYDPVQDAWRTTVPAPLLMPGLGRLAAAWDGDELIVWGSRAGEDATDTAAYDPITDTWRELPDSPLTDRCRAATVWTGSAIFVWSGQPDCDVGLPPEDGAMLVATEPQTDPQDEQPTGAELPEGCQILEIGERRVSTYGVLGASLGPTLLAGIRPDLEVGPLVAVESDDPHFETPWYVISAVVTEPRRGIIGTATWLSPHLIAAYAGGADAGGADLDDWEADPTSAPDATHLYAANDLATQISIWQHTEQTASAARLSRDCAQQAAAE
jgi:hypothetical protein